MKRGLHSDVKGEEITECSAKRPKEIALSTATTDSSNSAKEREENVRVSSANAAGSSSSDSSAAAAACRTTSLQDAKDLPLIAELSNASVCMRDKAQVETIIRSMQRAGPNTLQVISDFDMTLTRFAHNGTRCPTTHGILEGSELISEGCKKKMLQLLDRYYPIEIDPSIPLEEKIPQMEDWWNKAHDLLIKQNIRKEDLARAVRDSGAMLREGYEDFFELLREKSVPLLIFSAGVGDVLEAVITEHSVCHPNVKIFSNYLDYNEQGVAYKFKGELIHTFNKREGALKNTHQFLHDRTNVLLLGDSLGDLNMADGVKDLKNILRIGYLNDKVEERKEAYVSSYDITLVKDETLDIPNAVLRYITSSEELSSSDQ